MSNFGGRFGNYDYFVVNSCYYPTTSMAIIKKQGSPDYVYHLVNSPTGVIDEVNYIATGDKESLLKIATKSMTLDDAILEHAAVPRDKTRPSYIARLKEEIVTSAMIRLKYASRAILRGE